jgi:hypothetical protein
MLKKMAVLAPDPDPSSSVTSRVKQLAVKIVGLILLTMVLGFGQGWAASRFYGTERVAGFYLGMIQGALMPAALPALLIGKDVPIYAPTNDGRLYKLGYILGINICGTFFFGVAFWRSKKRER